MEPPYSPSRLSPLGHALVHAAGTNGEARAGRQSQVISLHFTGPPVPITARVHSTPQNNRFELVMLISQVNSGSYFGELSIIREQSSKSVSDCRLRGLLHTDVKPLLSRYATGESSPLERSTLLPPNDQ
eukprot:2871609-Pyramimonas_sp.AAC.1